MLETSLTPAGQIVVRTFSPARSLQTGQQRCHKCAPDRVKAGAEDVGGDVSPQKEACHVLDAPPETHGRGDEERELGSQVWR